MIMRSTNQLKESGSIPASALQFKVATLGAVSRFIKRHHYSRSHPGGIDYCFAAISGFELLGVAAFGHMAGNPKAMVVCNEVTEPSRYRELMRLVLLDKCGKNSESMFLGFCIRWLKRNTDLVALVSFADPKYGHNGGIYQASNWLYTGLQKQDRDRIYITRQGLFGDLEREIHPRQAYNMYGTSAKIPDARYETRQPKHRYVYLLRDGLTCRYPIIPFTQQETKSQ